MSQSCDADIALYFTLHRATPTTDVGTRRALRVVPHCTQDRVLAGQDREDLFQYLYERLGIKIRKTISNSGISGKFKMYHSLYNSYICITLVNKVTVKQILQYF